MLQYTSGRICIVATYRNDPADISNRIPTQNISLFEPSGVPPSKRIRTKYEITVAAGADIVNAYNCLVKFQVLRRDA